MMKLLLLLTLSVVGHAATVLTFTDLTTFNTFAGSTQTTNDGLHRIVLLYQQNQVVLATGVPTNAAGVIVTTFPAGPGSGLEFFLQTGQLLQSVLAIGGGNEPAFAGFFGFFSSEKFDALVIRTRSNQFGVQETIDWSEFTRAVERESAVPETSSFALLALGLGVVALRRLL